MTTEIIYHYRDNTYSSNEQIKDKEICCKTYYVEGKRHRLGGPAVEYANGSKFYLVENKYHRLDGPAKEWPDGSKQYWVDGVEVTDKLNGIKEEDILKYLSMLSI